MSHLDSTIGNPGEAKRSAVVLLRWVLVIATASLILFGHPQNDPLPGRIAVLLLIFSNLLLASLPARYFASGRFDSALVVLDVIVVSASLWVSGRTGSDFYLLYFVIIMIAALGETLRSIIVSALLVSTVYIGLKTSASGYEKDYSHRRAHADSLLFYRRHILWILRATSKKRKICKGCL